MTLPDALDAFEPFRQRARALLAEGVPPGDVVWEDEADGQRALFGETPSPRAATGAHARSAARRVPSSFVGLGARVAQHRGAERWDLLYRALVRLTGDEPHLLELTTDPLVARLRSMAQAVRRDDHHMRAFVRFRRLATADGEHYVAWYRPEHRVLPSVAPFFARRFPSMRWTIVTPDRAATCDGGVLTYGPGAPDPGEGANGDQAIEALFRTYYGSVFNPARVNLRAMHADMPAARLAALPEASIVRALVRDAGARTEAMAASHAKHASAARAFVPDVPPDARALPMLRNAAAGCTACALCTHATQTVFGEGAAGARLMLVGEQPGDREDREGRPFVGPAGEVLDAALARAGLDRAALYVTNAVKHFKWTPRGTRRLHARPSPEEADACFAWLEAEIAAVRPAMIVCLGATAAHAFFGPRFAVTRNRGRIFATRWAPHWMATYHPAALLRLEPEAARVAAARAFEEDLARAAATVAAVGPGEARMG